MHLPCIHDTIVFFYHSNQFPLGNYMNFIEFLQHYNIDPCFNLWRFFQENHCRFGPTIGDGSYDDYVRFFASPRAGHTFPRDPRAMQPRYIAIDRCCCCNFTGSGSTREKYCGEGRVSQSPVKLKQITMRVVPPFRSIIDFYICSKHKVQ